MERVVEGPEHSIKKGFRYSSVLGGSAGEPGTAEKRGQGLCAGTGNRVWRKDEFTLIEKLGSGRFATVYKAVENSSKKFVALKQISKEFILENDFHHQLRREIEIHSRLNHPNIIKLFGYFQDSKNVYMVMELAEGGTLFDVFSQRGQTYSETEVKKLIFQLLHAIAYLEKRHIIHRDIKLENVLLDAKGNPKLSDFGWAAHAKGVRRKTFCGTMIYLSPEQVRREEYTGKIDVWSLGVMTFELTIGSPPFSAQVPEETFKKIQEKTLDDLCIETQIKSPELKNLIRGVSRTI